MIRVISYNLYHSRAAEELAGLVAGEPDLDALCVQEAYRVGLSSSIGGLRLAAHTGRNMLALAVYVRHERFEELASGTFELKKSLHDAVFDRTRERVVGVHLRERDTGRELVVASFHAAPPTARSALRRQQIQTAHDRLLQLGEGAPVLMVGDYNYPLFHNRLGHRLGRSGIDLTLSDKRTYQTMKIMKGHFDFVTATGIEVVEVQTLPRGRSDHAPILVTAQSAAA
ncbi:MAG TPA: endonuclease/exonuclease/phosphatase family protein [Microbacteriaceae bacterium]|nr:endonuclease/exonuclease/phosphatase family protein [Microbacteriaceae bacterium]